MRRWKAEMRTWADRASVSASWLSQRVVHMNIHRGKQTMSNVAGILCPEFVGLMDGIGFPVGPVYVILKYSNSKWVFEIGERVQTAS